MGAAVLLLLFLARIQLPGNKPIAVTFRKRYSGEVFKTIQKFVMVDYKLNKANLLDINFLNANGKTSYRIFWRFIWLIKTVKLLLPIVNVNRISYRQIFTIKNHVWELCKMNLIVCEMIYILAWVVLILPTFLLFLE